MVATPRGGGCVLRFAIASIHWMLASPLLFFLFIIVPLVCAIISWLQRYLLYILFDLNLFIMKKSIVWGVLAVVLLCTTMISCNVPMNKESYVKGFVKFVEDVESNGANYTLKDWEKADDLYENYTDDYYVRFYDELTREDQKILGRCVAKYTKARMASELKGLSDDIEDGANFMEGYLDEIGDDMSATMEDMMRDLDDD